MGFCAGDIVDGVVTLTDREGKPVRDQLGRLYTHKLKENENEKVIAGRLTKLGKDPAAPAQKLNYLKIGYT